MTDYQPTEQDKVLLDYAQTAQRRADPWAEFEFYSDVRDVWLQMEIGYDRYSGGTKIRRKPRTVTLKYGEKEWELPVFKGGQHSATAIIIDGFNDEQQKELWRAALREIAGGENG